MRCDSSTRWWFVSMLNKTIFGVSSLRSWFRRSTNRYRNINKPRTIWDTSTEHNTLYVCLLACGCVYACVCVCVYHDRSAKKLIIIITTSSISSTVIIIIIIISSSSSSNNSNIIIIIIIIITIIIITIIQEITWSAAVARFTSSARTIYTNGRPVYKPTSPELIICLFQSGTKTPGNPLIGWRHSYNGNDPITNNNNWFGVNIYTWEQRQKMLLLCGVHTLTPRVYLSIGVQPVQT